MEQPTELVNTVKISSSDLLEFNTTPFEIKNIIDGNLSFNKLREKHNIDNKYNYLGVKIETINKDEKKWRNFKLVWMTKEDSNMIISESINNLRINDNVIIPILNYRLVFESYMNKEQTEGWSMIFKVIFHTIIELGGVLSQNRFKAFTQIMEIQTKVANLLKDNPLNLDQILITRHLIGKLIDPSNLWLGSKGMQLVLVEKNNKYSLVARKPGKEGFLANNSEYKYIEILEY